MTKCKDCYEYDKTNNEYCEKCKHIDNWQLIKYPTFNKLQSFQVS